MPVKLYRKISLPLIMPRKVTNRVILLPAIVVVGFCLLPVSAGIGIKIETYY